MGLHGVEGVGPKEVVVGEGATLREVREGEVVVRWVSRRGRGSRVRVRGRLW